MERKTVTHSVQGMKPKGDDSLPRVLELIISRKGSFRTDENWVHRAADALVEAGVLVRDGSFISIGSNFEDTLIDLAKNDSRFGESVVQYRKLMQERQAEYNLIDLEVYDKLKEIKGTDERILYLCSTLSETMAKLDAALSKSMKLEAKLEEMDFSLSVLESQTDENTDG